MANWTVSYGSWWQLKVTATEVEVDTANNRSKVRVQSSIYYPGGSSTFNSSPQTLKVNVNGSSVGTQTGITFSLSTTNRTRTLNTYTSDYITHNADGSKSVNVNVSIADLLGNSGNVNQTLVLSKIARASSLTSFSIGSHLKNGTANTVKLAISRQSTSFTHDIELRDGTTVIQSWNGQGSPTSLTLLAGSVNTLLNRMASATSKTLTLRVQTKSGSTNIGSAITRNATATVHEDVKPTVSAVTLSQDGNPVSTHTLQGFSKIKASFTRSAGYGATISSSSIQVRRRDGGADSQTINSNDGTTANPVSLHGVYEARGTARDSRGRTTNTAWATITVTPYNAPTITNFSAVRNGSTPTTVNISRATIHTVLGTSNHLTYTIQRRQGTGAWSNVNTGATGSITTSGATGSATSTGNSVTSSYEFRLVVTDKLGGRAESLQSVPTQRVVLDIHKDLGVGVGKIHEKGVLDVDGEAYFNGDLYVNGTNISTAQTPTAWSTITDKPATATRWPAWGEVTSKPAQATRWPTWSEVTSKPSTFAPSSHTHNRSQTQLRGATNIASGNNYSLSQSILNFDLIVIHYSTVYTNSTTFNADTLTLYPHGHPTSGSSTMSIGYGSTGRWVGWQFTNTTTLRCTALSNTVSPRIRAVYGVKFTA